MLRQVVYREFQLSIKHAGCLFLVALIYEQQASVMQTLNSLLHNGHYKLLQSFHDF